MPHAYQFAAGALVLGLLWYLLNKTFKKMLTTSHEIQRKLLEIHEDVLRRQVVMGRVETTCTAPPLPSGSCAGGASAQEPDWLEPWASEERGVPDSRETSLEAYHKVRNQYLFIEDLLPHEGHDDQVILDFGCGSGTELVGFLEFSRPGHLVGMDSSTSSLALAQARVSLHRSRKVELIHCEAAESPIPLDDGTVDYIHCCGRLHRAANLDRLLPEFSRVLSERGQIRMAVYNEDSLWVKMVLPWKLRDPAAVDGDIDLAKALGCGAGTGARNGTRPSVVFTASRFIDQAQRHGFAARLVGCAISAREMAMVPRRFEAMAGGALDSSELAFVRALTSDPHGRPLLGDQVAGLHAVYELTRTPSPRHST